MENHKKMYVIHSIVTLYKKCWPKLWIAKELGIDVKTVRRYLRLTAEEDEGRKGEGSKSLFPPAGNLGGGGPGRLGQCEGFRDQIVQLAEQGLTAQRIYQDLVAEEGYPKVSSFRAARKPGYPIAGGHGQQPRTR